MNRTYHCKKYTDGTKNPLVNALLNRFMQKVKGCIEDFVPQSVLDVGCGDGSALHYLSDAIPQDYLGIDMDEDALALCRVRHPFRCFQSGNIFALPMEDGSHHIALCLEVLEHLEDPECAVRELLRVVDRGLVLSVPWEPWFQLGNLARGKHIFALGNHPEHIHHWTPSSFGRFLHEIEPSARIKFHNAWPWIIASMAK